MKATRHLKLGFLFLFTGSIFVLKGCRDQAPSSSASLKPGWEGVADITPEILPFSPGKSDRLILEADGFLVRYPETATQSSENELVTLRTGQSELQFDKDLTTRANLAADFSIEFDEFNEWKAALSATSDEYRSKVVASQVPKVLVFKLSLLGSSQSLVWLNESPTSNSIYVLNLKNKSIFGQIWLRPTLDSLSMTGSYGKLSELKSLLSSIDFAVNKDEAAN